MAVTPDNSTLIVAESYGKRLTAFAIAADGGLSNRRVWAELGDGSRRHLPRRRGRGLVRRRSQPTLRARPRRRRGAADRSTSTAAASRACSAATRAGFFMVPREWWGLASGPTHANRPGLTMRRPPRTPVGRKRSARTGDRTGRRSSRDEEVDSDAPFAQRGAESARLRLRRIRDLIEASRRSMPHGK